MGLRKIISVVSAAAVSLTSCGSRTSTSVDIIGGADKPTTIILTEGEKENSDVTEKTTETEYVTSQPEENQEPEQVEEFDMAYNLDDMFKFNELNTYFDIHVAGLDGECFEYNIYFEDGANESKAEEISAAIDQWQSQYDDEDYLGYIDISLAEDSVFVYLDLGSIEDCDRSIYGIVDAIRDVQGIREVIVNESMDGMEDF